MSDPILLDEPTPGVSRITLNRPDDMNTLTIDLVDDVDVFLTNLAMTVTFFEELSTAETYDEVISMNMSAPDADLSTSEVIKAKLGITDERVPDTDDIDELIAFCS